MDLLIASRRYSLRVRKGGGKVKDQINLLFMKKEFCRIFAKKFKFLAGDS
ncbi:hypothetical protein [Vulcanibacillus modesticaldus]|nr:hypothetical protein [Vulcanibacillus modesticaldus]